MDTQHNIKEPGQEKALSILNPEPMRIPGPQLLHHLVPRTSTKGVPALEHLHADGTLTKLSFEELDRLSTTIADRISLLRPNTTPDHPFIVPVLVPQSPELYITLLAILKAGGAFCPLNLDVPSERLSFILNDASASVVLTTREYNSKFTGQAPQVLLVDELLSLSGGADEPPDSRFRGSSPEDMAYVMYTSGSTGTPKGVGISHDAATQSLLSHDRLIPEFSRFLQFAAPTFDVSVFEIFFPLFRGRTLVSCTRSELLNNLPAVINRMRVDACELTPTVAGSLLRTRENAPCLRFLLTIGEMMTERVLQEFGGTDDRESMLWAMYGPTEATIHCTLQCAIRSDARIGCIGVPLDTTAAYILSIPDDHQQYEYEAKILPVGEVGELALGGHQLAHSYLNRPEQTRAAFVDTQYGRLYRTGDKARLHPDGFLECLGRISEGQVKLRGQRIELGEIEQAAGRAEGCHGAIAAVISGILVLFCLTDLSAEAEARIMDACRSWLPSSMIPNDVVSLQDFPRLPSGKVDRRSLRETYASQQESARVEDRDEIVGDATEQLACQAAERVLGVPVRATTRLSAIGMDSLRSIQYAADLRSHGLLVGALDILQARSIADLCRKLKQASPHKPEPQSHATETEVPTTEAILSLNTELWGQDAEAVLECTSTQQGMLAVTHGSPGLYWNVVELEVPSGTATSAILAHISALARANEILRTGFAEVAGRLVQIIWKRFDEDQVQVVSEFRNFRPSRDQAQLLRPFRIEVMEPQNEDGHRVMLAVHHALYDGWTMDLFRMDLAALLQGKEPPKRPQFRHIIEAQRLMLQPSKMDAARKFWAEALLNFQPATDPQLLDCSPEVNSIVRETTTLELDISHVEASLRDIHCGPQVLFQAAVVYLWSMLVGVDDVVIGTISSGRAAPISGIEAVMGPLLEIMPLRVNLSQLSSIKDLLHTVHASNRASLPHAFLPLFDIKKAASLPAAQALYSVLFVYQESLFSSDRSEKSVREVAHLDSLETELVFEVEPAEGHFNCQVTYHTNAWSQATIACLLDQLKIILSSMIKDMDSGVSSLSRHLPETLLSRHNVNPCIYSQSLNVASAVERTAAQAPDSTALCFAEDFDAETSPSNTITFGTLNRDANRIARCLQASGAGPGSVVAIIMEKSIPLYTAILGIIKTGSAYLPLLPSTPRARIDLILEQANVGLCVTDSGSRGGLQGLMCNIIDLDKDILNDFEDGNLNVAIETSSVVNIIYTSGSTGVPKGVRVTHLNILSNIQVLSKIYPFDNHSRLLQSCSQAFDVSVFEIFFTWAQGMCLCSAVNDVLFEDLERAIRVLGVTHLSMTPTVAALVDPKNVPSVEFLVTSGEAMTEAVASMWSEQLFQGYGPSETTNICTVKKMRRGDKIRHLGHAFENTFTIVLKPDGNDAVPLCSLGELCFGGDQVTAGYLNLPDLTSQKFIDHPEYGRLYRSGDLGRMLPDGSLTIQGRIDDQVKLRGQRLELKEIDSHLVSYDEVSAAVTLLVDGSHLVSFVVASDTKFGARNQDKVLAQQLVARLASALPNYMVPSHLVAKSSLPVTSSGKLHRKMLLDEARSLSTAAIGLSAHEDGEWSEMELQLAAILGDILAVKSESIGRWTPLSSLGLDSISAIKLGSVVRQRMGPRLMVSSILRNSTIGLLAKEIQSTSPNERLQPQDAIKGFFSASVVLRVESEATARGLTVEKVLPCTPLQESMLVASGTNNAYVNRMTFRVSISVDCMARAWRTSIDRHGILRTCFISVDDSQHPVAQVVLRDCQRILHVLDASALGKSLDELVQDQLTEFGPAVDTFKPPVSVNIVQTATGSYLSLICHHALYDGEAMDQLFAEVEQLCDGMALKDPPTIEPFLANALSLPDSADEFWKQHLAGFQTRLLQYESTSQNQEQRIVVAEKHGLTDIEARLKSLGISSLHLFQSAWSLLLSVLVNGDDLCFGNVFNGRSVPVEGIDHLVAPCFNTVPLRVDLSGIERNLDLLRTFRDLNPLMLEYQFTPLRRIQASYGGRLFDSLLLMQQSKRALTSTVWSLESETGDMDFPFACEVVPDRLKDHFEIQLHHDSSVFTGSTAQLILDLLSYILDTLLAYPSSSLLSYRTIPGSLRQRLESAALHFDTPTRHASLSATPQDDRPWTSLEELLRSTLSSLSSVATHRISHHTTIYQLGLDSISAVRVAASLRQHGFRVTSTDVMAHPTCDKLALFLDADKPQHVKTPTFDLAAFAERVSSSLFTSDAHRQGVEAVLPTTPLQANLLAEFTRSSGKNYFNFLAFQVNASVAGDDLETAWRSVIDHIPILRTGFAQVDDSQTPFAMIQYASSALPHSFKRVLQVSTSHFNAHKWRLDAASSAFDNLRSPPWQVAIVKADADIIMHLAIHHALYDAASLRTILGAVLTSIRGAPSKPVPETAVVVKDVLAQGNSSQGYDFWTSLASGVAASKFPTLTPLASMTSSVRTESARSSASLSVISAALRKRGVTIQSVLQAAWARLLASYTGSQAVTFGVVLSGRTSEATEKACFPCVTTLPVICDHVSSNRDLVDNMMSYNAGLHQYQHTSLSTIHKWLNNAGSRLFDTLLVYQKFVDTISEDDGFHVIEDVAAIDYAVSLEVEPREDRLIFQITFQDSVVPPSQASLILRQFDAVLSHLVFSPESTEEALIQTASAIYSVTPAQDPCLPSDITLVHEFVETQAKSAPHKIALEFVTAFHATGHESRTWTYRDLNDQGDRAAHLIAEHARHGDIVALCFDKCPEAHFAILGILKAGCTFLALDPGAPLSRNQFIIQDSGASLLLTDRMHADELKLASKVPTVCITEDLLKTTQALKLKRSILPSSTCYCLYTSGTTGTPKGCEITHENVVQCMLAFQRLFDGHWDENSRWLQFASFHFDVSVLEQYWTWSVGITLVAAPRDLVLEDLAGTISRLQITHIDLTPSLARLLHPKDVPSLCRGVFITGGEQLRDDILETWGPTGAIHNFYGPTEATIGVTTFPCVPKNGRSSNIGRQFDNVGTFVLLPGTENPVLRGGIGELCVSGKLVGKGYLGRDELTRERFPVLERYNERIYRTGDLVRILHDGCFEFLGRADDQVKLRGQRLEIGEINHALRTVPDITDAVTVVVKDSKGGGADLLASFLLTESLRDKTVLKTIHGRRADELCQNALAACRARLPTYMVPSFVLLIPFIPLSANNKADLGQLRALFRTIGPARFSSGAGDYQAQSGICGSRPSGRKLLASLKGMGLLDDAVTLNHSTSVFDLGLDSISVHRLVRALKNEGISSSAMSILQYPVLHDLAEHLHQNLDSKAAGSVIEARLQVEACQQRYMSDVMTSLEVSFDQIEYVAPCSPLQQGMISRGKSFDDVDPYFNTFTFKLQPTTSADKLRAAWKHVIAETPILRTRFVGTKEGFVQVALKAIAPEFWVDVEADDKFHLEEQLVACKTSWLHRNRDDIQAPLQLVCAANGDEVFLVLHLFHGCYDAISLDLLLARVTAAYHDKSPKISATSKFLEALIHGPLQRFTSSRGYWEDMFRGTTLPTLQALTASPSVTDISVTRAMSVDGLENARAALNVAYPALVQALWMTVLRDVCGGSPTVGLVMSGRSMELDNADQIIGPLLNTLPFRCKGNFPSTWEQLAKSCHEFHTETLPFQQTALRDIQKWCSSGKPLFDTLFSFRTQAQATQSPPTTLWTPIDSGPNSDYPLALDAVLVDKNTLQLELVARKGFADMQLLNQLLDQLAAAGAAMINDPRATIETQGSTGRGLYEKITNGFDATSPTELLNSRSSTSTFQWTEDTLLIRQEIAALASILPDQISETTTLLELGLDSIDTIKLSARLKTAGIELRNSQLLKAQCIVAMGELLKESTSEDDKSLTNGVHKSSQNQESLRAALKRQEIDLSSLESVLPCTSLQEAMIADMINSNFTRYFNHDVLELSIDVDLRRLKEAWLQVIQAAPILRTTFALVEDPNLDVTYCQRVHKNSDVVHIADIHVSTIDGLDNVVTEARVRARHGAGERDVLQLAFARTPDRCYLILSIAHALYDGWSLHLMHQDVRTAYLKGYTHPRPSYNENLGEMLPFFGHEAEQFWTGYLRGVTRKQIAEQPQEQPATPSPFRTETVSPLSVAVLRNYCKKTSVSMQALCLTCWAVVLSTQLRSLDVVFGTVLSGRDSTVAEELMFPTMNTVPVRLVMHGTVSEMLKYVQGNWTDIRKFQQFPLRKAQQLANVGSEGLFNTLFVFQRGPPSESEPSGPPLMKSIKGDSDTEYPLSVEAEILGDQLAWRTASHANYLGRHDIAKLLHQLDVVLRYLVEFPEADLLTFGASGVSMCTLPPFMPEHHGVEEAQRPTKADNDVHGNSDMRWSNSEEVLRAALSKVAGVPASTIQKTHNLYSLGLDSISVIKLSTILRKQGIKISARELLAAPSITELAALATRPPATDVKPGPYMQAKDSLNLRSIDQDAIRSEAGLEVGNIESILPATSGQIHMISAWQNSNGAAFFPKFQYRVRGDIDANKVAIAAMRLIEEFPILRTTFVATESSDVPIVQLTLSSSLTVREARNETQHVFSSARGSKVMPLVILSMAPDKRDESVLLGIRIHHSLYDAVSLDLVMKRFGELCEVATCALDSDASSSIATWTNLISRQASESSVRLRQDFWTRYLRGAKLQPGLGNHSGLTKGLESRRTSVFNSAAVTDISPSKSWASKHGLGIHAVFFAVYAVILARQRSDAEGHGDVVFGVYLANRSSEDENGRLPFPTLSLVPCLVRDVLKRELSDVAKGIQADLREISKPENASVGLWDIDKWTGVKLDSFINFLSLPDYSGDEKSGMGIQLEALPAEPGETPATEVPEDGEHDSRRPCKHTLLQKNPVKGSYMDAIDVELAIRENALDIGVFGSEDKIDVDGASRIIDSVQSMLGFLS